MRIRFISSIHHPDAQPRVWDRDNGRWASTPFASIAEAEAEATRMSESFWQQVDDRAEHGPGATLGFYFAGLGGPEANAMRARFNAVAASLGYTAQRGRTAGQGNGPALIVAIANGAVTVTPRVQD